MVYYETEEDGFGIRVTARLKNAKLVGARESLDVSAKSLAEKLGIPYQTYLAYENMQRYPSLERQQLICDYFREMGIFLFEDNVFPEELRELVPKKQYVSEKTIPREKLLPLSKVDESLLPVVQSQAEENANYNEAKKKLDGLLDLLSYREREVIELRCGMKDGHEYTFKEAGMKLNLTREMVGYIENRALEKLTAYCSRNKDLTDLLTSVLNNYDVNSLVFETD